MRLGGGVSGNKTSFLAGHLHTRNAPRPRRRRRPKVSSVANILSQAAKKPLGRLLEWHTKKGKKTASLWPRLISFVAATKNDLKGKSVFLMLMQILNKFLKGLM
jgi:hypothetical protein